MGAALGTGAARKLGASYLAISSYVSTAASLTYSDLARPFLTGEMILHQRRSNYFFRLARSRFAGECFLC